MAEGKEELKSLLMKVKEENEKVGLKLGSKTCESIRECLGKREFPTKENANSKVRRRIQRLCAYVNAVSTHKEGREIAKPVVTGFVV